MGGSLLLEDKMADVVVNVMIDGRQSFAHAGAAAPNALDSAIAGLQAGLDHFKAVRASAIPQTTTQLFQAPKDTSL